MTVGVISHLENPGYDEIRELARASEAAGADWLGVPDAFWWRDTWLLLAEAARVTQRIGLGPLVTNPYLRHPFLTVAAIASLQDLAGPRVFVGLGAGGSEVRVAARISRRDAGLRIEELAGLIRSTAAGQPLDPASGRTLEVPLSPVPITVAARADAVLRAAGRVADEVLLWAVPQSELERSVAVVREGHRIGGTQAVAMGADVGARPFPKLIWAPIVNQGPGGAALLERAGTYAALNNRVAVRERWGVTDVDRMRDLLVAGRVREAAALVPAAVFADLAVEPGIDAAGAVAARIGASGMAVAATDIDGVHASVSWAREVLQVARRLIEHPQPTR